MSRRLRAAGLPAIALVLVAGVLGMQLAYGGGTYTPLRPADPCAARTVTSHSEGIEGLTERLVLMGLDNAACSLGVSREALILDLARPDARTDPEIDALHQGLLSAVTEMKEEETLPPASELADEALESADLNGFLKALLRAIPDSAIDGALKTDDVLISVIDNLDLRTTLTNLDNQDDLNKQMERAVTRAVVDSLIDRLRDLL